MIYMDNAATTKMRPEVIRSMILYMTNKYANPSGAYTFASETRKDIESARKEIADTINSKTNEIYFTSGGTESDNWAIKMAAEEYYKKTKKRGSIIVSAFEHHAVLRSCEQLEKKGVKIIYVRPDKDGIISVSDIEKLIRQDTFLISIMSANNEIGTLQPISQIGLLTYKRKILFHTDAVQAYTNIPIDVEKMHIDMLSTSAHKINGPKGIGFLYIRSGKMNEPFINGGMQENKMRAGTENTAAIIGFSKAAMLASENMQNRTLRIKKLRNYMCGRMIKEIKGIKYNGHPVKRLPGNMNFSFEGVDGGTLLVMLDRQGICASAGSACSTGSTSPSHVLKAIDLSDEQAFSTLRFTINENIGVNDIDYVIECLKKDVAELRKK